MDIHPNDGDNYIEIYCKNNLTTPIVINENSQISMFFDFNTQNTVHYASPGGNDAIFFTPPQEGTKFQITVDGVTTTITNSDMRIDF